MKNLYKFYWDCGSMGHVESLFVSTQEEIDKAIGKTVSFGEVLGKHSEIGGVLEETDLKIISQDMVFIFQFEQLIGKSFGYNPLDYITEN